MILALLGLWWGMYKNIQATCDGFCQRYRPKKKKQKVNSWGSRRYGQIKLSKTPKPTPLGQMKLPFAHHSPTTTIIQPDINQATLPFIKANRQSICNLA